MTREANEAMSDRVTFNVSAEQKEQIQENAAFFALSVSDFLRHVALGGTIDWQDRTMRKFAGAARKEAA